MDLPEPGWPSIKDSMANDPPLTALIQRARSGDRGASEHLYSAIYDELRGLARGIRSGESAAAIDTTALVHETWIKLAANPAAEVEGRAHFKHIAARAMRQVLVDEARARNAAKRGGGQAPVTLQEALAPNGRELDAHELVDLDRALSRLESVDPRVARVVDCRFFGGMDVEETAAALDISTATVKRDWRLARAWLAKALEGSPPSEGTGS